MSRFTNDRPDVAWPDAPVELPVKSDFELAELQLEEGPLSKFNKGTDVAFIFGESCCGQKKNGPQHAPPAVVSTEFIKGVTELGWNSKFTRCLEAPAEEGEEGCCAPGVSHMGVPHRPLVVAKTCTEIREAVGEAHKNGYFPMMVGGDHCLGIGTVAGTADVFPDLCLLWFDAHADINTVETSGSGNIHGMPLSLLIGITDNMKGFEGFKFKTIPADRVAWIGLRDVDPGEEEIIKAMGIKTAYRMKDIAEHGIEKIVQMCLDHINPDRTRPVHLSFDVDGCDPKDMPSTGTPVDVGVSLADGIKVVTTLRHEGVLASMDVVEVNPSLGTPEDAVKTIRNTRRVMYHALGAAPGHKQPAKNQE